MVSVIVYLKWRSLDDDTSSISSKTFLILSQLWHDFVCSCSQRWSSGSDNANTRQWSAHCWLSSETRILKVCLKVAFANFQAIFNILNPGWTFTFKKARWCYHSFFNYYYLRWSRSYMTYMLNCVKRPGLCSNCTV